ncbi:Gfo/Idh/MocA family protein [Acidomonas methanolica]|uniref:Gfo/Idh/MocA family protein n=2 Tax=Acidomonas methanolica TaxID=437 RepID=UPI001046713B|nr:Gfo/Idh/MocA family oxidoreductase [Acidomonas methanolica]TCS31190.1 myo-inositol 2-dehydrogenase/D-chiro-inositol 1-dehydrogenase [Acidomonas methanolica]GBQ49762.1 myo-inositol 2-dehydrogenase [Acidomonas methanolica]GEK98562.1 oxidoreductase [Acidomonas methanolica NBRC 104435]
MKTLSRTLSLGLLGAGEVAQLIHLPILRQLRDRYQVTALYDPSPSVLSQVGDAWGIPHRHHTADALVADPAIDAVMILSPDQFHGEHARAALRAGKHVFLEKPACLTVADLQSLIEVARQTDRVTMVGYMRCYAPAFTQGQALLKQMGETRYVRVRDLICEGPWFFAGWSEVVTPADDIPGDLIASSRARRLADLKSVCGDDAPPAMLKAYEVLTGLGVHSLSALRMLLGSPRRVIAAHVAQGGMQINALLDYGTFVTSYECLIDDVVRFDATIEVISGREKLDIHYDTPYIRNLPGRTVFQTSTDTENTVQNFGPFYKDPFRVELEHFHDAVIAGLPMRTPLQDALADLDLCRQIMAAARQSAA